MAEDRAQNIYTIPAGVPFARSLAAHILEEYRDKPDALADMRILLPTRRGCRTVQDAFLRQSGGQAMILPGLQALGDVDEDELSVSLMAGLSGSLGDEMAALPPAMPRVQRQIMLARLIYSAGEFHQGFDHALALAQTLGHFMDQVYTEDLSWDALESLVPGEFAEHWQITLEFLSIIIQKWPLILNENNCLDYADRRRRLLGILNRHWQESPPCTPIVAAGSTGSIPAVASLLRTISSLPAGRVVLPGLDRDMDEESWAAMEESHPQYGFRQLLERMGSARTHVKLWPSSMDCDVSAARRKLVREVMRPAHTSHLWRAEGEALRRDGTLDAALGGLHIYTCAHQQEEASLVSLLLREVLEKPEKTAVLITPDRTLAQRVVSACQRWGVRVDDSAGQKLNETACGSYLMAVLDVVLQDAGPVSLLSMCKHTLGGVLTHDEVRRLDRALRGHKPAKGFDGLKRFIERQKRPDEDVLAMIGAIEKHFEPLLVFSAGHHHFADILNAHILVSEHMAQGDQVVWGGDDGEAVGRIFSDLLQYGSVFPDVTMQEYADAVMQFLKAGSLRARYGTHPRVQILGQLEARLVDADLVVLGGLNEGSWPPDAGHDPWMSRPMRKSFGLPGYDRGVGLAAHDFVQGFCAPRVVITRADRVNGSPTVPARWIQRLGTVLSACGLSLNAIASGEPQGWVHALDVAHEVVPCVRPAPAPPVDRRPRELAATRIELLMRDPYSIYARYVLGLLPLDPPEKKQDAALRGSILHDALDRFVQNHPQELGAYALSELCEIVDDEVFVQADDEPGVLYWSSRLKGVLEAYVAYEKTHRSQFWPIKSEVKGAHTVTLPYGEFTVTARADRIDRERAGNGYLIIDYKSAGTYTGKSIANGQSPQMPIEALILFRGGFGGIAAGDVLSLQYWLFSGSDGVFPPKARVDEGIEDLLVRTEEGLAELLGAYDRPEMPYYSVPVAALAPRYNDYDHLARVQEWSAGGDDEVESEGRAYG